MPELHVLRHVIRPHQPHGSEEYDPSQDMLLIFHKNPDDPDDPSDWAHHIRLNALGYRKEMWGLSEYADVIDQELKDLERYYARREDCDYDVHPLAHITEHYFDAPPARMRSFSAGYVMDRVPHAVMPSTTDGVMQMCADVAISGISDVKGCLASDRKQTFPCKGMTGLSADTVIKRAELSARTEEQSQQLQLVPSAPLDEVRQLLTDRASEMETAREAFVNHALTESQVPEIMRRRAVATAVQRGLVGERAMTWT